MTELAERIRAEASRLGFARVGFAEATRLDRDALALEAWIERGDHASMEWMARTADVRADVRHPGILEGARSVIVLVAAYGADDPVDLGPGTIARYARGRDYHRVLSRRLWAIGDLLLAHGHRYKPTLDSKPVMERAWAERSGVGFLGKNACLIVPGLGSHVVVGCVITDAVLPYGEPMREGCGTCVRCLEGCPTDAFRGPRALDARRCISYLTIEHEGAIEPELRGPMGGLLFGCDVCQDVCPYNQGRAKRTPYDPAFAPHPRLEGLEAASFLEMDEPTFLSRMEGSPIRRSGRDSMARNAALVLGNAGGRRHLPVLREAAERDVAPSVRDAAAWAVARIEARHSSSDDS